jgi:hypothetical protein
MTGRLGSTDFVNSVVIAHPSNLTQGQIRAIKVNLTSNVVGHLRVSPASLFRSPLLGHWPKVKLNRFRFQWALHH